MRINFVLNLLRLHTPGMQNNPPTPDSDVEIVSPQSPHQNYGAVPVTPQYPSGSRTQPFPPRPPKGSLGIQGLARPRGVRPPPVVRPPPRWAMQQPLAGGQEQGTTSKAKNPAPKWVPKQTTAPGPHNPLGNPWGRALGKGRRPGHYNEQGVWEGRNKGRKRHQWASKPIKHDN